MTVTNGRLAQLVGCFANTVSIRGIVILRGWEEMAEQGGHIFPLPRRERIKVRVRSFDSATSSICSQALTIPYF
jgi:hypothetical protein